MLKIGSIISNRVILAMTHKFVLAQCIEESPEPFTVWRLYDDMSGVHSGSYFKDKMDAEWEFCSQAFPWFQDNVNIQDPDEETAPEGQAQEQADRIDALSYAIQKTKEKQYLLTKEMIHDMSKQFQSSFGSSNSPEGQAQEQTDRIDVPNCTIQKAKNLNIDIKLMSENAKKIKLDDGNNAEKIKNLIEKRLSIDLYPRIFSIKEYSDNDFLIASSKVAVQNIAISTLKDVFKSIVADIRKI